MSYPERLLPHPYYKKITWNEALRHQFLIHHTSTKDVIDPSTLKLRSALVAPQRDHLRDYSTNLLGVFLINDIYWAIQPGDKKEYFLAVWDVGADVKSPKVPAECDKDENRGYFFLSINNCHEILVPYEDDTAIQPVCKLLHTPTNSNFWHFSLRWFCNGVDVFGWSKNERRRAMTAAKSFIIEKAFFEEPVFQQLPTDLYHT